MTTPESRRTLLVTASSALLGLAFAALACASNQQAPAAPDYDEPPARTVKVSEPGSRVLGDPAWPILPVGAPDPMFSCVKDPDCTVLEIGCCDHCNGGWQMSVNGDFVDRANETWREPECTNTACTKLACAATLAPICDGGVCARREELPDATGAIDVTIVRNVLPPR